MYILPQQFPNSSLMPAISFVPCVHQSLQGLPSVAQPGALALLKDKGGDILAKGYYEPGAALE
jgi:hypothetical protein